MKYLKFLSQKNFHPDDYFQSNLTFIVNDSSEKIKIFQNDDIKDKEKIYPDASEYLYLDSEPLENFHSDVIKIEV